MALFNAIGSSVINFSRNCFEDIKNRSPKYNKAFSNLGIDTSKILNGVVAVRECIVKGMRWIMQDREGNLMKLKSNVKDNIEVVKSPFNMRKDDNNYDIGE